MLQAKQHIRGGCQEAQCLQSQYGTDQGIRMTKESMEHFLNVCRQEGCTDATVYQYGRQLECLYAYLPEEKTIHYGTLEKWREALIKKEYVNRTVNSFLSVGNAYLDFVGHREYQVIDRLKLTMESKPELTRAEYLRLLRTARNLGKDRVYLLIKLFGTTDLNVREMPKLTVEAIKNCKIVVDCNRSKRIVRLSGVLQEELLDFARRKGIEFGPIFLTRDGRPISRVYVTRMIRAICPAANVAEEKGSPRCLKRLYQTTRAGLESNISLLIDQAHDRLLEQEQLTIGWVEA